MNDIINHNENHHDFSDKGKNLHVKQLYRIYTAISTQFREIVQVNLDTNKQHKQDLNNHICTYYHITEQVKAHFPYLNFSVNFYISRHFQL